MRIVPAVSISVALCTCNGEKFLRAQLESIEAQSCSVDEIIVCDDCSDDTTAEIVLAFAAETSVPVKWFRNATRLGVTKNFERAISLCSGEFIFLCDQDDRWMTDKVAALTEALQEESVGLVFSNAQVVREDLSPWGYRLWDSIWFDAAEQARVNGGDALPVLLRHAIASGSTLAFKSKYLPVILPIPDFPHSHDIWITLMIACIGQIRAIDRDLIQYRLHGNNQVGMEKYGLLDQIRMAKYQLKNGTFAYLADLHQTAYDRLTLLKALPLGAKSLQLLNQKVRHSRVRDTMPGNWFSRLVPIWDEIKCRNYSRYSYGWKSVLQDLFLR